MIKKISGWNWKKIIKVISENLIIVAVIIIAMEWWQARSMVKGKIDQVLTEKSFAAIPKDSETQLLTKDKATLIYVIAPWCSICKLMGSSIENLSQDDLEVKIIALSWEDEDSVAQFRAEAGMNSPILLGDDSTAEKLGISSFPSYIIVDSDSKILKTWSGYTTKTGVWLRTLLRYVI